MSGGVGRAISDDGPYPIMLLFCFKFNARDTALADYRSQSTCAKLIMVWNRHSSGAIFKHKLHDNVAAALTNF